VGFPAAINSNDQTNSKRGRSGEMKIFAILAAGGGLSRECNVSEGDN